MDVSFASMGRNDEIVSTAEVAWSPLHVSLSLLTKLHLQQRLEKEVVIRSREQADNTH